jgi:HAD superfamily hydrolase (TIGR01509 family)
LANIEAFLFDLDGTLMDSEVIYVEAVKLALADQNCLLSQEEAVELVYGKGWKDIFLEASARFPAAYASRDLMGEVVRKHFLAIKEERDIRIPGSIDLLRGLAGNHRVAIVSGSLRQEIAEAIKYLEIGPYLEFYLGADDYFPGKPDPSCYLAAADKLELAPAKCLVFEDSSAGVTAAKRAGMYCVALRQEGMPEQDLTAADAVFGDLSEFRLEEFQRQIQ